MMRPLSLISILFLLFTVTPLAVQDTIPAPGWPVEQRCLGDPTPPPDGWTYDGTIFAYKAGEGVRGLRADLSTPYHVTYEGDSIFNSAGSFSPDRKWFAVPVGNSGPSDPVRPSVDSYYTVSWIIVYNTGLARETHKIRWAVSYSGGGPWVVTPLYWLDKNRLVYERGYEITGRDTLIVNPFTSEVIPWGESFNLMYSVVSPDLTRAIVTSYGPEQDVYDFLSAEPITQLEGTPGVVGFDPIWLADSSYFVAARTDAALPQVRLYDRDGKFVDVIYESREGEGLPHTALSPDRRYLSMVTYDGLYIADLQQKHIFDVCLSLTNSEVAWSYNNDALAVNYDRQLTIIDVDAGEAYTLPNDVGNIIAWSAAD